MSHAAEVGSLPTEAEATEIERLVALAHHSGAARVGQAAATGLPVAPAAPEDAEARAMIDRIRGVLAPGESANADRLVTELDDGIRLRAAARTLRTARR